MAVDEECTILLGLKDRVPFTQRWMSYANSIHLPFPVFIADGGSDDAVQTMLSNKEDFPHVAYEYVRYPYDRTYSDYWTKISDALARIRTPFVAVADDDDFFIVPGVRDAIRFLQNNPDYATCGGQCAVFWLESSTATGQQNLLYADHVEWKASLDTRSLTDESASARIRQHSLRATHPAFYHVRRTASFRTHAEALRDAGLADPFLIERLLFFLSAIAGKAKQLETLYLARQWDPYERSGRAHEAAFGDWFGRMLVPSWSKDFAAFVDVTSSALAAQDGVPINEARRTVIELYRQWLAPQMLGEVLAEPTVTMSMPIVVGMVRRLLERPTDNIVRRIARMLYRRTRWISVDAVHGTQLRSRRVSHADEAFKPIQRFLTSPPHPSA